MKPREIQSRELSRELRHGSGRFLESRRGVIGLSLLAAGSMGLIALYQLGILEHLPEPPRPYLDANEVDAAPEAYGRLGLPMPDAALGFVGYGITLALAATGGEDRAAERPRIPLPLAARAGIDAVRAAKLTWEQRAEHRAFCSWCLLVAGATFAVVLPVNPEARAALRSSEGFQRGRAPWPQLAAVPSPPPPSRS
jgi:vitamin K epoxide reductase family protein